MTREGRKPDLQVVASNDIDPADELGWGEPWDFYTPLITFAIEMVKAGRFSEDRPEDRLALKIAKHCFSKLSDSEVDISNERLAPLVNLYFRDRAAFEIEFARRREPGFYDKPKDDSQGELF
jgi:hypothetical protein